MFDMKELIGRLRDAFLPEKWDPVRGTGGTHEDTLKAFYTDGQTGPPSQKDRRTAQTPEDADRRPRRDLDRRGPSWPAFASWRR